MSSPSAGGAASTQRRQRALWTRLLPQTAPPTLSALLPLATMGMAAASSAPDLTVLPDAPPPPPPPPPRSLVYGSSMRTCAVCLEDYLPGDRLRMLEPCNHCFHQNCIDAWLQPLQPPLRKPLCPVCNATVSLPCVPDLPASPTAWPTVQLIDLSVHQSWLEWFVDLLNLYYQPHTASS